MKHRRPSDTLADLNKIVEEEEEADEKLKEKQSAYQQFPVDTEMKMGDKNYLTSKCLS